MATMIFTSEWDRRKARRIGERIRTMALAEGAVMVHQGDRSTFAAFSVVDGRHVSKPLSDALKAEIRANREALAFYSRERRDEIAAREELERAVRMRRTTHPRSGSFGFDGAPGPDTIR